MIGETGATLDKHNCLRTGNIKAASASHVLTHQNIVHPNHIIARFAVLSAFMFAKISRRILFLNTLHPAHFKVVSFTAVRTGKVCRFHFLSFVKNVGFSHVNLPIRYRASSETSRRYLKLKIPVSCSSENIKFRA